MDHTSWCQNPEMRSERPESQNHNVSGFRLTHGNSHPMPRHLLQDHLGGWSRWIVSVIGRIAERHLPRELKNSRTVETAHGTTAMEEGDSQEPPGAQHDVTLADHLISPGGSEPS